MLSIMLTPEVENDIHNNVATKLLAAVAVTPHLPKTGRNTTFTDLQAFNKKLKSPLLLALNYKKKHIHKNVYQN